MLQCSIHSYWKDVIKKSITRYLYLIEWKFNDAYLFVTSANRYIEYVLDKWLILHQDNPLQCPFYFIFPMPFCSFISDWAENSTCWLPIPYYKSNQALFHSLHWVPQVHFSYNLERELKLKNERVYSLLCFHH